MIVLALSTGHKIVIATMGAIFIGFALVSSFVIPRRNPNFPNRNVGWYVLATFVLFVAMLTTILVFGVEEEHEAKGETPAGETSASNTEDGGGGGGAPAAAGDAAAGKSVFTSAGCSGCHTLKAAGSSGNVGPNLDDAKPDRALIHERVTNGKPPMPSFKGQLNDKQIADVVAFVYSSTHQ
jgi:cytochrome c2